MAEKTGSWLDSRKVRMVLCGKLALLLGLGVIVAFPAAVPAYTTFAGSIVTLVALYHGGNVGQKWIEGRAGKPDGGGGPERSPDPGEAPVK